MHPHNRHLMYTSLAQARPFVKTGIGEEGAVFQRPYGPPWHFN